MNAEHITKTIRSLLFTLMLPALLLVGCDTLDAPCEGQCSPGEQFVPPQIEGPELVTFKAGEWATVDYLCENPATGNLDIEVLRVPDGASYAMQGMSVGHNQKVTVMWNPSDEDAGIVHEVFLRATARDTGLETIAEFGIEVLE